MCKFSGSALEFLVWLCDCSIVMNFKSVTWWYGGFSCIMSKTWHFFMCKMRLCNVCVLGSMHPLQVLVQRKSDARMQTGLHALPSFFPFTPCLVIPDASASKTSGGALSWGTCAGGGEHVMTFLCQLPLLSSPDPRAIINYPICAITTVSSRTQLWETNTWADLE